MTKLCKAEMDRFERERINDFKESLERFLEGVLKRQNEVGDYTCSWRSGMSNGGVVRLLTPGTSIRSCY